jgi:2-aminomuconate deaminase
MSATEVAQAVGINLATVHRFLLTLESEGAIARTQNGRFHLGHSLADLGGRVEGDVLLIDAAQPHLEALAAEFRETVHCTARSGNKAVNVARALPDRSLFISQVVGEPFPLHSTAAGKVFLAAMSPGRRTSFMAKLELTCFTAHTITDPEKLGNDLDIVARQGFATENEEREEGVRSVAVPIHNGKGVVIAAIALSAPASRLNDDVLRCVREAIQKRVIQIERSLFTESRTFSARAQPLGNYPHLKRAEDFIFISGTTARRPDNSFEGAAVAEDGSVTIDFHRQTEFIFESISDMLESVGASLSDLVEVQAFLIDISGYSAFNEVYSRFFTASGPARATVGVNQLTHPHQGLMVRAVAFHKLTAPSTD